MSHVQKFIYVLYHSNKMENTMYAIISIDAETFLSSTLNLLYNNLNKLDMQKM